MRMDMETDDEKGKLFVGGLSWETTQESLSKYFSRFGDVIDCVVMKNSETGRSRGFGFVTFADPNNVDRVLANGPHNLDGRTIDPKPCNPRTMQKPKRGQGYPKVFLGGLPSNVTETDLRGFFGRYGKVMEVVIMYDQEKKKSRGFGFLSFEDEASVERVVTEHYLNLNGKQVEVKKAEPREGQQNKAPHDNQLWGGPHGPQQVGGFNAGHMGPNGQMNGPPVNMQMGANMMGGWGTGPAQQPNYGYGNPNAPSAQWGQWGPPPQGPPPHQWGNYNAPTQQQSQGYSNYDPYNTAAGPTGPSANNSWNSWNMQTNSASTGSAGEMYSRPQTGPGPGNTPQGNPIPTVQSGPAPSKPTDYNAYNAGYGNYASDSYPPPSARYGTSEASYIAALSAGKNDFF